jgi:hypothetical protein
MTDFTVSGSGIDAVQLASVTLAAEDILALGTTALELIPAPEGRRYIWPLAMLAHYRPGTTAFSDTTDRILWVGWDTDVDSYVTYVGADRLGDLTERYRTMFPLTTAPVGDSEFPAGLIEGTPLVIYGAGIDANDPFPTSTWMTEGDGELTVRIWFSTIDGSPS